MYISKTTRDVRHSNPIGISSASGGGDALDLLLLLEEQLSGLVDSFILHLFINDLKER